jgi:hypothetical protein
LDTGLLRGFNDVDEDGEVAWISIHFPAIIRETKRKLIMG